MKGSEEAPQPLSIAPRRGEVPAQANAKMEKAEKDAEQAIEQANAKAAKATEQVNA